MADLNWIELGKALRRDADLAHENQTPHVSVAYSFLLDNAEGYINGYQESDFLPVDPPAEFISAYYEVPA